jgi:hypothetical protein
LFKVKVGILIGMRTYPELIRVVSDLADRSLPTELTQSAALIEEIEQIALSPGITLQSEQEELFSSLPVVRQVRDLYEHACTLTEDLDANNSDSSIVAYIDQESTALCVDNMSNVVFIGCGSVPESVLLYSELAAHVTGLECRPDAVLLARNATADKPNVTIHEGLGEEYDYRGFGHIVVALMVRDKSRILEQIAITANDATRVIVRTVSGVRTMLHEPLGEIPASYKDIKKVYDNTGESLYYSQLLEVQKNADI